MAKTAAHGTKVWFDQYLLESYLTAARQRLNQALPVVTTFDDIGPRRVVDNYDVEAELSGLFDGDSAALDARFWALIGDGADHYLSIPWGSGLIGSIVYDHVVSARERPIEAQLGQAILLNGTFVARGGTSRGIVLRNGAVTGTENAAGQNLGTTASGQTFRALFRVISGTFTSVAIAIQESSDNGAGDPYATISGMTATVTAAGITVLTTTAATEAWKRFSVTAFTGTSVSVRQTAGRVV